MNIAIIEDNTDDKDALCSYIEAYCSEHYFVVDVKTFCSGEELLESFKPGAFDLLFVDVFLPGMTGVDTARKIRETDRDCLLVFITVSSDFAMDGFLVQASGYVVKPIDSVKMANAMHACRFVFERNRRTIALPYRKDNIYVSIADLLYVETKGKDIIFHMKSGELRTRLSLRTLEEHLGGIPFLRCNRSFIINMNYVDRMQKDDFVMRNGDVVPIRKNNRGEIKIAMTKFTAGQLLDFG